MKVLRPAWLGAGEVLAQSNTSGISVEAITWLGVMPKTKPWVAPGAMPTGASGFPISVLAALVVW